MQEVRGGDGVGGGVTKYNHGKYETYTQKKKGNILNYLFDIVYLFQLIVF